MFWSEVAAFRGKNDRMMMRAGLEYRPMWRWQCMTVRCQAPQVSSAGSNCGLCPVRGSQPFFNARFSYQELNPFSRTAPICLPDDEKSPGGPATMELLIGQFKSSLPDYSPKEAVR